MDWDKNHEPKNFQLYLAAIPGSTTRKPLEDEAVNSHIQRLHNALIHHGYTPAIGDIIDGYPLSTQSRGQKGLPIVITYKSQKVMETVRAASIKAGFWNDRRNSTTHSHNTRLDAESKNTGTSCPLKRRTKELRASKQN